MRIICVGFYELTSTIITTLGRISPWSETPQPLEKSNPLRRARSSPSHKSAACIIGIDEPHNFGATGPTIIPLGSIEDGLLRRASYTSLQTGHQLNTIQIATTKWKLASAQSIKAVFMRKMDFLPCTGGTELKPPDIE